MTRILIADDHGIVRAGLKLLLAKISGAEVVAEASDGREAVRLAKIFLPDIVLIDVAMPLLNGLEAARQISRENSRIGIIILSMYMDETYILKALDAGAKGYLIKDNADEELSNAILSVAAGRPFFSKVIADALLEDHVGMMRREGVRNTYDLLTEREREVLHLLAEGKSNKEAAAVLNLSPYTIDTHRTNMMQKLGLHNTAEIVLYAVRNAIITP
ncbi:MAG TPA: response regulator transcription factor [Bryobacteraceae bacterium]|nr:response regulator transcription factor [Bryobacteraceae bacterium]